MVKRIGLLTVAGIVSIIIVAILSLVPSLFMFWGWYGFLILGFLFGVFLVIVDFIYTQKRSGNKIFDPRLFVFVKIVIIGFVAFMINAVLLMTALGSNAGFFTEFVCLIFYIPSILVGLCIFLILLRTPAVKYFESKKMRYFYVILAVLIVVLPIIVGWPMLSPTYTGRQPVIAVKLSSDGSRLLSVSGGEPVVSSQNTAHDYVFDYIVWNMDSGDIIWNETTQESYSAGSSKYVAISPNGNYLVGRGNIISIQSGQPIASYTGRFLDWSANNTMFVTTDDHSLTYVYTATNFSLIRTLHYRPVKAAFSPTGTKLAIVYGNDQISLVVIDISSGDVTYVYHYVNYAFHDKYLSWSEDETQLQLVRSVFKPYNSSDHTREYSVRIWNISDNSIVHNLSFTTEYTDTVSSRLLTCSFGKYLVYETEYRVHTSKFLFYNLTGLQTQFDFGSSVFDISYDGIKIAVGSDVVQIRNATTGEVINIVQPPEYELVRPMPGFEFFIVLCAIPLIVFWGYRKKK